ncbi:MAG: DUF1810 domain-containing protein [Cyanobacteria bacterium P01_G01_bin.39]
MIKANNIINQDDLFNLNRFISAQENVYNSALLELKNGNKRCSAVLGVSPMSDTEPIGSKLLRSAGAYAPFKKRSHWMWYIFPQFDGLGRSATARHYGIKSIEEAQAYLNHPILGKRLLECANTILNVEEKSALEILGYPDDLKLKSSMTLFSCVASETVFVSVLNKYFSGEQDIKTLQLLKKIKNTSE